MAHQFLKVAILIIGIAIYALLWNTMTHFGGYDELHRSNPPTLDARIYDKVRIFLLFIGYNRSRHTLLASLLDAHPHVVVANDFNILKQWITMPEIFDRKKYFIYELIYAKSRYDVMYGVRSRLVNGGPVQYHYNVKGQWQGQINEGVQVIGDKKAAQASKILLQSEGREHLRDLERKLGTKLKFIHVVRNPFDNIATLALRKAKLKKNEVQDNLECDCHEELDDAIAEYSTQVKGSSQVKKNFPGRVLDVHGMDLMENPRETLMKICDFLEITCTEKYLEDCVSIVNPVPSQTRQFVKWTKKQLKRVQMLIKNHSFLQSYSFEN
ncbi:uncharacterized protein [Pocillopora verrucosa]|uniref:uncharacterized protein n=1 Tax=Pocillopora verrucosa TaxID=203993 RepID=UPI0033418197